MEDTKCDSGDIDNRKNLTRNSAESTEDQGKGDSDNGEDQAMNSIGKRADQSLGNERVGYCKLRVDNYGQLHDYKVEKPSNSNAAKEEDGDEYASPGVCRTTLWMPNQYCSSSPTHFELP